MVKCNCGKELSRSSELVRGMNSFPPKSFVLFCDKCGLLYYEDISSGKLVKKGNKIYSEEGKDIIDSVVSMRKLEESRDKFLSESTSNKGLFSKLFRKVIKN